MVYSMADEEEWLSVLREGEVEEWVVGLCLGDWALYADVSLASMYKDVYQGDNDPFFENSFAGNAQ